MFHLGTAVVDGELLSSDIEAALGRAAHQTSRTSVAAVLGERIGPEMVFAVRALQPAPLAVLSVTLQVLQAHLTMNKGGALPLDSSRRSAFTPSCPRLLFGPYRMMSPSTLASSRRVHAQKLKANHLLRQMKGSDGVLAFRYSFQPTLSPSRPKRRHSADYLKPGRDVGLDND